MSNSARTPQMTLIVVLLIAILALLILIAWRGVHVEHTGSVDIGPMQEAITLRMSEPVTLEMPEPGRLITTGPDGGAIPLDLPLPKCPSCESTMLPARWNLWTGEIDWVCPACGESSVAAPANP